jgi:hypothetical protein
MSPEPDPSKTRLRILSAIAADQPHSEKEIAAGYGTAKPTDANY